MFKNIEKNYKNNLRESKFNKREFRGDIIENYKIVKESNILRKRWTMYSKKYSYAKDVEYDEILEYIGNLIETIENVLV